MIWKSIKSHLFSEDSFPRDFYLQAYSTLCCANDLNPFSFLIKAPNILLPSSPHSFPKDEKAQNLLPHTSLLESTLRLGDVWLLVSFSLRTHEESSKKVQEENEQREGGEKTSTKHKRKPPKVQT